MRNRIPTNLPRRQHGTSPDHDNVAESRLPLPHERDESGSMTGGKQSKPVQQGHKDLQRGLKDTSKAPEMDKTYRELKSRG